MDASFNSHEFHTTRSSFKSTYNTECVFFKKSFSKCQNLCHNLQIINLKHYVLLQSTQLLALDLAAQHQLITHIK